MHLSYADLFKFFNIILAIKHKHFKHFKGWRLKHFAEEMEQG